jgi:hypothetical protein
MPYYIYLNKLHDLHYTPDIVPVIKAKRIRWEGHVECIGERSGACRYWLGSLRETDHWDDQGIHGKIISKSS